MSIRIRPCSVSRDTNRRAEKLVVADVVPGQTVHQVKAKDGEMRWVDPLVDAKRGRTKTSAGRMGMEVEKKDESY